jgi:hypothetical protein
LGKLKLIFKSASILLVSHLIFVNCSSAVSISKNWEYVPLPVGEGEIGEKRKSNAAEIFLHKVPMISLPLLPLSLIFNVCQFCGYRNKSQQPQRQKYSRVVFSAPSKVSGSKISYMVLNYSANPLRELRSRSGENLLLLDAYIYLLLYPLVVWSANFPGGMNNGSVIISPTNEWKSLVRRGSLSKLPGDKKEPTMEAVFVGLKDLNAYLAALNDARNTIEGIDQIVIYPYVINEGDKDTLVNVNVVKGKNVEVVLRDGKYPYRFYGQHLVPEVGRKPTVFTTDRAGILLDLMGRLR